MAYPGAVPRKPLPFSTTFADVDEYIESTLAFISLSGLFQKLCGGIHILEFLTQDPDLYTALLPSDWRQFFEFLDISDILDLLLRDDVSSVESSRVLEAPQRPNGFEVPASLLDYIEQIRQHILDRTRCGASSNTTVSLPRHVAVGMKPKKVHEVSNLAKYVDNLSSELSSESACQISHFVDFGSGQNYLGRALASSPYNKNVIAIESKPLNIDGARLMDVTAKLAPKESILRNKKQYRAERNEARDTPELPKEGIEEVAPLKVKLSGRGSDLAEPEKPGKDRQNNVQYIQSVIRDGDLSSTLPCLDQSSTSLPPRLMVISLHSCGNLLHHGLRSLILNPSVHAVALVGCCYNLLTERLPPPTYQQPSLRSPNLRLEETSSACDPDGFPMSERLAIYKHPSGTGIRFNITARMMAVQAPSNWIEEEYNSFFTRHFYRALLQKILVAKGVVNAKVSDSEDNMGKKGGSPVNNPLILGSLRKTCYTSFLLYARAAIEKLGNDPVHAASIKLHLDDLTDEEILRYETDYGHKKKELSI
ncbi:MAG: hypothetical protein Q9218_007718, partial [Villophora microphyllina]